MENRYSIGEVIPSSGYLSHEPCFFRVRNSRRMKLSALISFVLIFVIIFSTASPVLAQMVDADVTAVVASLSEPFMSVDFAPMEETEVQPAPEITAEPTLEAFFSGDEAQPTPDIAADATPEPTTEVTTEVTPEITPDVTPEATPVEIEITPEVTPEITPIPEETAIVPTPEPAGGDENLPTPVPTPVISPSPDTMSQSDDNSEEKLDIEKLKTQIREELLREMTEQQKEEMTVSDEKIAEKNEFSSNDCYKLSTEELYCFKKVKNNSSDISPTYKDVFVSADDGDNEIIFQTGDRTIQVTNNHIDDLLPVYDKASGLIVWQSLIGDRWQIMVYDINEGIATQLTDSENNNLNPSINNGYIVWQGWSDNNWEILLAVKSIESTVEEDGTATEKTGWTVTPITDNSWHDINPKIFNDYILWEAYTQNNWQIFSYSFRTKNIEQLSSGVGNNKNPRLAVLWESEENGVLKTLQYDINTQSVSTVVAKDTGNARQEIPEAPAKEKEAPLPSSAASSSYNPSKNNDEE